MIVYLKEAIFCFFAALFFAVLLKTPRRAIAVCAIIGTIGYIVYAISLRLINSADLGFFLGTFIIALCSETAARIMKMPAAVFITSAVIPLVPGVGLYKTMLFLVQEQFSQALQTGAMTMLAIAEMAMAIAICSFIFKMINSKASVKEKL